jgi:membrane-associated phospholipid phosphatase
MTMKAFVGLFIVMSVVTSPAAAQTNDSNQTEGANSSIQTTAAEPEFKADPESKKEVAPPHAHTGWATLLKDTAGDFVAFPKRKSTWTLLGIGAAAALATHPADNYVETHVVGNHTADHVFSLGTWVGTSYVQVGSAVGLWAVGRYVVAPAAGEAKTNKYSEVGFDLIRAQIVSQAIVHGMKYSIRRDRPTGECCAFPSGHAATAFAAASVLERHLGYRASWPALVGATYVATSRLVDNRHFLSDVMFGAAVGMASGWTVVGARGRSGFALQPVPVKGGMLIALTRTE